MGRIVTTDSTFPSLEHEEAVARRFSAEFSAHQATTEREAAEVTAGADVVFVNFAPITREVLAGLAPDAVVIRYGVGYDNVDLDAARELGVRVANVPDYGTDTVAGHAAALVLALLRKLHRYDRAVRESGWCAPADFGAVPSLATATAGLIGTGRIGVALAGRLQAFGMRIVAFDPYADRGRLAAAGIEPVELDALLAAADAVSLHAPATPETHHILDGGAFAKLRRGAVVVNTARGALIDEPALCDALESGQVSGAGLDVFESEPLAADSRLRTLPNVILTPHVAWFSDASVDDLQRLASEEAARALSGEPLRCQLN